MKFTAERFPDGRSLPTKLIAVLCALSVYVGSPLIGDRAMAQTAAPAQAPATKAPAANKAAPPAAAPAAATPAPQAAPQNVPPAAPLRPLAAPGSAAPAPKASGPSIEEIVKPVNGLQSAIEAAEKNLEQSPG